MTPAPWLEARVGGLISSLADSAPTDVDAMAIAQLVVGSGGSRWRFWIASTQRTTVLLFLVMALVAALASSTLIVGGRYQSHSPADVLTPRPFVEPFIGLPPDDAAPSVPEAGKLVLSFFGRPRSIDLDFHAMSVYADGRLIWTRNLDWASGFRAGIVSASERAQAFKVSQSAFGGSTPTTAVIEQRLTPEGVDLLRSTALASGSSGMDPVGRDGPTTEHNRPGVLWGGLMVERDGQFIQVHWSDGRLPERLADPESWLPAWAWADQRISGFVPSRYALCLGVWGSAPDAAPEAILQRLPVDVRAMIRSDANGLQAPFMSDPRCHDEVKTEDARVIATALEAAGLPQIQGATHLLGYHVPSGAATNLDEQPVIYFEPILPDGQVVCDCG